MKILYDHQIFSNPLYGGIARYFLEVGMRIARQPGAEVKVVVPLNRSGFLRFYRNSIPIFGCDAAGFDSLPRTLVQTVNRVGFAAYAKLSAPDVIHETYYGSELAKRKECSIVTTMHDLIPELFPQYFQGIDEHVRRRRRAIERADHIICVSESTRTDLLRFYDVGDTPVTVIPLGSSLTKPEETIRVCDEPYFLHVGGRYPYKNFDNLMRAFAASGLYRSHKLVSFSAHPLTRQELETMKSVGLPQESVITSGGNDRQLARSYSGAVALVLPSLYEGFGIPLLEAMRCDCPIITSNVSSLPEVAGQAALYCDPSSIESIAQVMTALAESEAERARLLQLGKARVRRFTWDASAEATFKVYEGAVNRSRSS